MSQTYFSKQTDSEKELRLTQFGQTKGQVVIWVKGDSKKYTYPIDEFSKMNNCFFISTEDLPFNNGREVLCSFEHRGMSFFSKVKAYQKVGVASLVFDSILYKAEKRSNYRLMTYPIYKVFAEFDLEKVYEGGNVVSLHKKPGQTGIFKNFLKLVDGNPNSQETVSISRHHIQDISASGMSIHIGEIEKDFFLKDRVFKSVKIKFSDLEIVIPEAVIVYQVDYIGSDKNLKKYKIGIHFPNLSTHIEETIAAKINSLLKEVSFNNEFEKIT